MTDRERTSSELQDDVNLSDVLHFFQTQWHVIIAVTVLGVIGALAYLGLAPRVYESTVQLEMAKMATSARTDLGAPIEDTRVLMERLRLPTTYTPAVVQACFGVAESKGALKLARRVSLAPVREATSFARLTLRAGSYEQANACTTAVVAMIQEQQGELLNRFTQEVAVDVEKMRAQLAGIQEQLVSMEKTDLSSVVYLAKRDESLWLREQIASQEKIMRLSSPTRIVTPIYTDADPVSPKPTVVMLLGLLVGITGGILVATAKHALRKER